MPKVLIRDGDFVIAFDPAKITKVTSTSNNKVIIYGVDGDSWLIDAIEHPKALAQVITVLSQHFEVIDTDDEVEPEPGYASPDAVYKIEKTGLAHWVKLNFPSQHELDFAKDLLETETRLEVTELNDLYVLSLSFAPFYSNYKENLQLIFNVLGEPVNAVEDY